MSEIIEGQAVEVLELSEEKIKQMSPEELTELNQRVDQMQEKVADSLLVSTKGWDIINDLGQTATKQVLATGPFVLPYMQNTQGILDKLSDPEAFKKQFDTLMKDIENHSLVIRSISLKHQGKKGTPSEEDHALVFALSEEYSQALDHFERVIEPLMNSLIENIKNEYGPILTVNLGE